MAAQAAQSWLGSEAKHDPRSDGAERRGGGADLADVQACRDRGCDIAVVPVGACEQHGPHLPMGTDTLFVAEAARRAAQRATNALVEPVALVFPPVAYGIGGRWASGEVWLRPSTFIALLADVVSQLDQQAFRHVVLVSGHGSNRGALICAADEARKSGCRAEVFVVSPWSFMEPAIEAVKETDEIGHACEIETSTSLHLFPGLVRMERVAAHRGEQADFWAAGSPYAAVRDGRAFHLLSGQVGAHPGFVGDPTKASADKGARLMEAWVAGVAAFLQELHAAHQRP
jgi:creatinine amidohydrolase